MEMEAGPYLTQIDCHTNNVRESAIKFKEIDNIAQNQCSSSSVKKIPPPKFSKVFLKHAEHQYKQYLPEQYYESRALKPGTQIYKIILEGEEKRLQDKKVPFLHIRMPKTLVMSDSNFSLIHTAQGTVKIAPNYNFKDLCEVLKENLDNQSPGKPFPAALFCSSSGITTEHQIFLSTQLYPRLLPKSQTQACVKYVQPYGNFPNLLRIFYVPKSRKNYRPNIGYKIVNKRMMDDDLIAKKYKQIHNFLVKDYEKKQNLNITTIRGKALSQVEQMTQSLIYYIEYIKGVRILEIVVDYVFGKDKVYYFHEIKSIKSHVLTKVWDIGDTAQILNLVKQNSNQIFCKLCGLAFKKQEMNHRVTNKLIVELITHLKNRGENISSFSLSLIKPTNLSVSCYVCSLCYQLILAQHQLIDIQQEFCRLLNMESDPLTRVPGLEVSNQGRINKKTKESLKTGIFSDKLLKRNDIYQWRIFFYLQKLKNLPVEAQNFEQISITMKFKGFKHVFKKQIDESCIKNQVFQIARIKSATPYLKGNKLTQETNNTTVTYRSQELQFRNEASVDMQKVKVFTFYTKSPDISELIQNEQLQFEMCLNNFINKSQSFKMKGCSSTLKNFSNTQQCQQHSCEILLFDEAYKYCNLELNVGLKFDLVLPDDTVNYTESEDGLLLYPDAKQNKNCIPLPDEWIQIINHGVGQCMYQTSADEKSNGICKSLTRETHKTRQLNKTHDWSILRQHKKQQQRVKTNNSQVKKVYHKRPQTCLLSESSRDTIKKSRFGKNIISPININNRIDDSFL